MLDLTKLAKAMQGISQHLTVEATASRQRLDLAQKLLAAAYAQQAELVQRQQKWRDHVIYRRRTSRAVKHPHRSASASSSSVIATDGPKLPNHHEIAYCYLLNVGRVVLHYGQNRQPLLDSLPGVLSL